MEEATFRYEQLERTLQMTFNVHAHAAFKDMEKAKEEYIVSIEMHLLLIYSYHPCLTMDQLLVSNWYLL